MVDGKIRRGHGPRKMDSRRRRGQKTRFRLATLYIFAAVVLAHFVGIVEPLDRALMDLRFAASQRSATGNLVFVDIDSRSLQAIDVWPWPRRYHAKVLDNLLAAGASRIALDIDFSSRSSPEDDEIFEQALARSGGRVILPVFRQLSGTAHTVVDTQPLPEFRRHVEVASVNISPDGDSLIRQMAVNLDWGDGRVPSYAAALADAVVPGLQHFYIDYGIRADSIPRISYVDVVRGNYPRQLFEGKTVIVGPSAIELGDVLPAPLYRALPGSMIIALAYESLVQDRALKRTGMLPTLLIAFLICWQFRAMFVAWSWRLGLLGLSCASVVLVASSFAVQAWLPVSIDTSIWLLALALSYIQSILSRMDLQALRIFKQRMAVLHRSALAKAVVETSFDAILVTDHTGCIRLCNPAAQALFGYGHDDLIGRRADTLVSLPGQMSERLAADAEGISTVAQKHHDPPREGLGHRRDGSTFALEAVLRHAAVKTSRHPLERRRKARVNHILAVRDVTLRKDAEAAKQKAIEAAQSASRSKSEFLAAMSHELKTPLNAIIGFSEILEGEMFGPLGSEQYRSYVTDIRGSGTRLLSVINDVLDVSRIEMDRMELRDDNLDVAELIDAAIRMTTGQIMPDSIAIRRNIGEQGLQLIADARLIKQCLTNLLSNAVRFTPQGGRVTVSAHVDRSDGALILSVADNGPGIPEDQLANVVLPFHQVDSSIERKFDGMGLGLPLTKAFVELHGGRFFIESTVGMGTTATCRLPAQRLLRGGSKAGFAPTTAA